MICKLLKRCSTPVCHGGCAQRLVRGPVLVLGDAEPARRSELARCPTCGYSAGGSNFRKFCVVLLPDGAVCLLLRSVIGPLAPGRGV